ncbi:hypothetical protein [Porphyromonas macacae]|uniref:hypothetical protein n=1 Tax=Porphyromonas macacae TaxID=28115 RepID=UPI001269BB2B|nr:hypothetical protein [Porphyromonas macacae]
MNIIGGKRKVTVTLLDYTPGKCRLKSGSHKEKTAILSLPGGKEELLPIKISGETGTIERDLSYDYSIKEKKTVLKYLWPIRHELIQMTLIEIATCRHSKIIEINIYPDIIWELAFAFSLENPLAYTHSGKKNNPKAKQIYKEAQTKAIRSGWDKSSAFKGEAIPYIFDLSLKSTFNTTFRKVELQLAKEFSIKIKRFVKIIASLKEWADTIKKYAGGKVKKNPFLSLNSPFSIEVMSPKLGASVEWKSQYSGESNKISIVGLLSFTADPLIGAEFTIDLLAVTATTINPAVGKILAGFRIGLEKLGASAVIELVFYGNLEVVLEALSFNFLNNEITGGGKQMIKGKMGVSLIMRINVKGTLSAIICRVKYEFLAEAKADAYFGGTMEFAMDEEGLYGDFLGCFSGLLVTGKIEGKIGLYSGSVVFEAEPILESGEKSLGKIYLI